MANGLSDDLAQAALMGQTPEEEQNNLMQAGLGLGGAAFAAQVGRAPAPVPMGGQLSPLAQQVAQNDAARQAAVRQAAAASRPIGSNLPANPASPAVGSSGGTRLPSNPSVAAARQAAATSAQRVVPSLASRALPMLGQGGAAVAGGYTLGSVLDNAFDISGNIARGLFPDAPTLTREERAALGQADAETETIPATTDGSIIGNQPASGGFGTQYNPYGLPRARQDDVTPLQEIGEVLGGPFRPSPAAVEAIEARTQAEPTILPDAAEEPTVPAMDTINDVMSRAGVPTQDQLVSAIQAPTQAAQPAMGLRTDPQGRMIPAGFETRAEALPEYERQAAAREARLEDKPDFMEAIPTSMIDQRGEVETPKAADIPSEIQGILFKPAQMRTQDEVDRLAGFSRSTLGKSLGGIASIEESMMGPMQSQRAELGLQADRLRFEQEKLQLENAGFVATDVETDPETGVTVQIFKKGDETRRVFKGVARAPQAIVGDITAGFVQPEARQEAAKEGFSIVK